MSQTRLTREALLPRVRSTLDFAASQAERTIKTYPGYVPMYTVQGKWNKEGERWTHWCEGFFPGILWLLHKATGDAKWRPLAEQYSRPLEPRRFDRAVHDLGFLFFSTYLRWYHLTGDAKLRQILIEAGQTLALRRQKGGYLASFIGPQSLFIDIMMNVGIIFWAARELGDDKLRDIAVEHCRTTAQFLVRDDGGTAHEGIFDLETGKFLHESTHQGYRADSTWTRGLAWAIYGFASAFRLSGEPEFLATSQQCAECYLRRAPKDLVPLWDFDAPDDGRQPYDSSAAAITASGLWDLSELVNDDGARQRYQTAALTMLDTLCFDRFLAKPHPEWEGILMHGVYHYHKNLGVDESVAWGEHFFVEALVKVLFGQSEAGWQLMRIGIISDTHNQLERVDQALHLLEEARVELILHCGDIEDEDIVWRFPAHTHFVYGNCDLDREGLRRAMESIGATLHEPFGKLELQGSAIAFTHGDNAKLLRELEQGGAYDFVFHGHTHQQRDERKGRTRVVNSGALHRATVKTCAVLDLGTGEIESLVVK